MPADTADLEDLIVRLAEHQRSRHYGKYRGLVVNVRDPEGRGRITANVPAIYGEAVSPWAMPSVPFAGAGHGFVFLPEPGDGVWIEFEGGDRSRPIWSGCWWQSGQLPSPGREQTRLIATSQGHQIVLDEGDNAIRLVHPGGAEISLTADAITLKLGGSTLKLTSSEINLNQGMAKVTSAGASLANDALKVGS